MRDYEPVSGRWTARDPIFFQGGQSNLYVYVGNDPIGFRDPSGLILPALAAAGAILGDLAVGAMAAAMIAAAVGFTGMLFDRISDWLKDNVCFFGRGKRYQKKVEKKNEENEEKVKKEHTNNQQPSNLEKHENGQARKERDARGEKADPRRPYQPPKRKGN